MQRAAEQLCDERHDLLNLDERERLISNLLDEAFGLGPLEPLMSDPTISDILVNGPDTVFIACHAEPEQGAALLGIASSRIEIKPYQSELWLYVDEVDVCADQRKKGAGKLIMQTLIKIAEREGCEELWPG